MPSNHPILCCPLLLSPSVFPSIRVFSNESALRIRWPKYWSFCFSISPCKSIGMARNPEICIFLQIFPIILFLKKLINLAVSGLDCGTWNLSLWLMDFCNCGTPALEQTQALLLHSLWDLFLDQGLNPRPLHCKADCQPLDSHGSPPQIILLPTVGSLHLEKHRVLLQQVSPGSLGTNSTQGTSSLECDPYKWVCSAHLNSKGGWGRNFGRCQVSFHGKYDTGKMLLRSQNLLKRKPFPIIHPLFLIIVFPPRVLELPWKITSTHSSEKCSISTFSLCWAMTSPTAFKHAICETFPLWTLEGDRRCAPQPRRQEAAGGDMWDRARLRLLTASLGPKADSNFSFLSRILRMSNPRGSIIVHNKDLSFHSSNW